MGPLTIVIGADIGQRSDPTAIVVSEAIREPQVGRKVRYRFEARHIERMPLGTPYPAVSDRLAEVVERTHIRASLAADSPRLWLVMDVTGVGRPVFDLVRDAVKPGLCKLRAATFTHGESLTGGLSGRTVDELRVGKAFLVSRLQALLQTGRVKLPADDSEAKAMVRELENYEIKISEDASDKYGAFKVGTHDDLVTALGLSVLQDPPGPGVWGPL